MRLAILPLIAIPALAGCENGALTMPETDNGRTFSSTFGDAPFDTGAVTVLTTEHGELHSYVFRLCGDGAVCSGQRRGHLDQSVGQTVITGTHRGRKFVLTPGGGGQLELRGTSIPLAWDDPNRATILAPTRFTRDQILNRTAS